ncbi:MAG: sensor histidine kinase [Arenicella sp.]
MLISMLINVGEFSFIEFGVASLYAQLILLSSMVLLCWIRTWLNGHSKLVGASLSFITCFSVFIVLELLVQEFYLHEFDGQRLVQLCVAVTLILILVLRFFSLVELSNQRAKKEVESRMQSLQARIQPHFLFNCLNTIAELTYCNPKQAEHALHSLAALFRSTIEDEGYFHSLQAEIKLCEQYLQLEGWRLGERLQVEWIIDVEPLDEVMVPRLLLQPIVENAIVHGVAVSDEPGQVTISLSLVKRRVDIKVENSLPTVELPDSEGAMSEGVGMALKNIRERLFVLYDDQYKFTHSHFADRFVVELSLPWEHTEIALS